MFTPEELADYRRAGKICAEARAWGAKLIVPGASILEISKKIEEKIRELGGEPAFPVQVSRNNIAAHWCPDPDTTFVFEKGDICKLDLGVHVNGYIADTAITVDLGDHELLVKAAREACEAALAVAKPGVELRVLGREIHRVITSYGFSPIHNLCGHGLARYVIHDSTISVPNYDNGDVTVLKPGMAIAIEPFATPGKGAVQEQHVGNIYSHSVKKSVRNPFARTVQDYIARYKGLPFTTHWLPIPQRAAEMGLRELTAVGALHVYPPLSEVGKGIVSQHEHTVLILEDGIEVTTR